MNVRGPGDRLGPGRMCRGRPRRVCRTGVSVPESVRGRGGGAEGGQALLGRSVCVASGSCSALGPAGEGHGSEMVGMRRLKAFPRRAGGDG